MVLLQYSFWNFWVIDDKRWLYHRIKQSNFSLTWKKLSRDDIPDPRSLKQTIWLRVLDTGRELVEASSMKRMQFLFHEMRKNWFSVSSSRHLPFSCVKNSWSADDAAAVRKVNVSKSCQKRGKLCNWSECFKNVYEIFKTLFLKKNSWSWMFHRATAVCQWHSHRCSSTAAHCAAAQSQVQQHSDVKPSSWTNTRLTPLQHLDQLDQHQHLDQQQRHPLHPNPSINFSTWGHTILNLIQVSLLSAWEWKLFF